MASDIPAYWIYEERENSVKAEAKRFLSGLTADQDTALCGYRWPGNIRELKNLLERGVLLSEDNQLELNLPAEVQGKENHPFSDSPSLEEVQRRYIHDVLKKTGGKISGPGGRASGHQTHQPL